MKAILNTILMVTLFVSMADSKTFEKKTCIEHMNEGYRYHSQKSVNELSKDIKLIQLIENHYLSAIHQCPNICEKNPEFCNNLGIIYQLQHKTDLAETFFIKTLKYNPNSDSAYVHLGQLYETKKLFALALDSYLKAYDVNPDNYEAKECAKKIFMKHNCEGIAVGPNDILPSTQLYNTLDCANIFKRAQKQFYVTRSIVVSPVNFRNIHFDLGSARLKTRSFPQLNNIVEMMNKNKSLKIMINGHTDDRKVKGRLEVFSNKYCRDNQCLSEYRALSVKKYLVKKGIPDFNLKTKGYAATRPFDINNKDLNRRVEIMAMDD